MLLSVAYNSESEIYKTLREDWSLTSSPPRAHTIIAKHESYFLQIVDYFAVLCLILMIGVSCGSVFKAIILFLKCAYSKTTCGWWNFVQLHFFQWSEFGPSAGLTAIFRACFYLSLHKCAKCGIIIIEVWTVYMDLSKAFDCLPVTRLIDDQTACWWTFWCHMRDNIRLHPES